VAGTEDIVKTFQNNWIQEFQFNELPDEIEKEIVGEKTELLTLISCYKLLKDNLLSVDQLVTMILIME